MKRKKNIVFLENVPIGTEKVELPKSVKARQKTRRKNVSFG